VESLGYIQLEQDPWNLPLSVQHRGSLDESWMDLPRMNAFWFAETRSSILGASLKANILDTSFAML
jgi:hypothetical protein